MLCSIFPPFLYNTKCNMLYTSYLRLTRHYSRMAAAAFTQFFPSNEKPFVVSVEGNIGCGKSTFIKHFQGFPHIETFAEPVNQWQNVDGNNLLDLLYKDPAKWSFAFQSIVQLTRLKIQTQPSSARVRLIERSLQNNRFCFLELGKALNDLSEPEYVILKQRYEWLEKNMNIGVDLIVYLRTDPETVLRRVQKRNRAEESNLSLEYLERVHDFYEKWLVAKDPYKPPAPVVIVDANQSLEDLQITYSNLQHEWLVPEN